MQSIHILLVEDNPADVALVRQTLNGWELPCQITTVDDGDDALEILRVNARVSPSLRPDVILLDLNLPRKSGFEVLQELSSDAVLREIPVIVLTVSNDPEDEERAYDLNASRFVQKPLGLDEREAVFGAIKDFILDHTTQTLAVHD